MTVNTSILVHGSFLVRGITLWLTLAELYGLNYLAQRGLFDLEFRNDNRMGREGTQHIRMGRKGRDLITRLIICF